MNEIAVLAVLAVLIIVIASVFAPRLGIASPILLVVIGIACSLIPGTPDVLVDPEWILFVVLPPILYSAAVNVPAVDFRRDVGTIGALSVGLVVISAFGSALVIWLLLPEIGFAAAVALGAVISPPDAVAATSIGKRLGLPSRLVTILEGEGLVNDATALVMLRTAITAIAGSVSFAGAIGDFARAVLIGVGVGAVAGGLSVWARSRLRDQPVLTTAISLVVPFLAFIPAEELHASGVIAVVTAGLITGHQSARRFSAHDRIAEKTNWRTLQLLLENGVFLLMGFEMTAVVSQVERSGQTLTDATLVALLATVTLVFLRFCFVGVTVAVLGRRRRRAGARATKIGTLAIRITGSEAPNEAARRRRTQITRFLGRRREDAEFDAREAVDWRGGTALAWSGMRGVVTLAAAQSLPADVPRRAELVLVAFLVAVITLVVQGGTLPALIRRLGIRGNDDERARTQLTHLVTEMNRATSAFLTNPSLKREDGRAFEDAVLTSARDKFATTPDAVDAILADADPDSHVQQTQELRRLLVEVRQGVLLDARATGAYDSVTIERVQHLIDSEATRLPPGN